MIYLSSVIKNAGIPEPASLKLSVPYERETRLQVLAEFEYAFPDARIRLDEPSNWDKTPDMAVFAFSRREETLNDLLLWAREQLALGVQVVAFYTIENRRFEVVPRSRLTCWVRRKKLLQILTRFFRSHPRAWRMVRRCESLL